MGRKPNKHPNDFLKYTPLTRPQAKGSMKHGKPAAWVRFPQGLFDQIRAEAVLRNKSFTAIVIELCEASIEGIE